MQNLQKLKNLLTPGHQPQMVFPHWCGCDLLPGGLEAPPVSLLGCKA